MRLIEHGVCAPALALLAMFSAVGMACAYDAPGHYYTISYALAQLSDPSPTWNRDRQIIAFCTWLPDASVELSATGTLAAAASSYSTATNSNLDGWMALKAIFSHPGGIPVAIQCAYEPDPGPVDLDAQTMGPVVIVQQLIHGLTGGEPSEVRSIALELASKLWTEAQGESDPGERANLLCATGFAFHLLGDSYAHRHLVDAEHSSEAPMYPTGCGHASAGHLPDHPLGFTDRWKDWETYFGDIASVFGSPFKQGATSWFDELKPPELRLNSDVNECLMESSLCGHMTPPVPDPTTSCTDPGPGLVKSRDLGVQCRKYVQKWNAVHPLGVMPTCPKTWTDYKEVALPLFFNKQKYPGAIAPEFDYSKQPLGNAQFYNANAANPEWQ